jgi:hypothetical protein
MSTAQLAARECDVETMELVERDKKAKPGPASLHDVSAALHDLCQPLTALQCRLEVAALQGTLEAYRSGVEEALAECQRMVGAVRAMRSAIQYAGRADEEPENAALPRMGH